MKKSSSNYKQCKSNTGLPVFRLNIMLYMTSPTAAIRIFIPNKDIVNTVGSTAGVVSGRKIRAISLSYEFNSNPLVFHTK